MEIGKMKKIGISQGNPPPRPPICTKSSVKIAGVIKNGGHTRSKLRRCEPRSRASKWIKDRNFYGKGAQKERIFGEDCRGDKQRVVVKVTTG